MRSVIQSPCCGAVQVNAPPGSLSPFVCGFVPTKLSVGLPFKMSLFLFHNVAGTGQSTPIVRGRTMMTQKEHFRTLRDAFGRKVMVVVQNRGQMMRNS